MAHGGGNRTILLKPVFCNRHQLRGVGALVPVAEGQVGKNLPGVFHRDFCQNERVGHVRIGIPVASEAVVGEATLHLAQDLLLPVHIIMLHVVCDLTIASENARFGQTGPKVGSFDGGFGSSYLARIVGQKKAREIWFLCRQYSAKEAEEMGLVNKVVPFDRLEEETIEWCRTILKRSPMAIRMIKRALNAELDGQRGLMEFAGDATLMYYLMEEAQEGKNAFLEKRDPDFQKFPKFPG